VYVGKIFSQSLIGSVFPCLPEAVSSFSARPLAVLYETLNTMELESVDISDRFTRFPKPICLLRVLFKLVARTNNFKDCENLGVNLDLS